MSKIEWWFTIALFSGALYGAQPAVADEQIVYRFCSQPNCADGQYPYSPLIADGAGNLYGTTSAGGAHGLGVVFKLSQAGTETVLYSFKGGDDGATPYAGLTFDSSGNLLGTTVNGGGSKQCGNLGCGTVFKLAPDGTETVLHAFCLGKRTCKDGIFPYGGLTLDAAGNVYGTTQNGSIDKHLDNGIVFRLAPDGKEKIVWSFGGGGDAINPMSGVFLDDKLGILGTASDGSNGCGCNGAIYLIRPNGFERLIHLFKLGGSNPKSGLTTDGQGNFYGTTANNGDPGTVYKLTPPHRVTVLHTFQGNGGDGFEGRSGVAYYNDNLYGTSIGGSGGLPGQIFRLTTKGDETLLHTFRGSPDGDHPDATPIVVDGNLYGTTAWGGTTGCGGRGCGTVFRYGPIE